MQDPRTEDRVQHETAVEAEVMTLPETSSIYHAPVIEPGPVSDASYDPRDEAGE